MLVNLVLSFLERSTFPPEYSSPNKPPLPPSVKQNDNSQNDLYKTRLMEKKQQQWKQENGKFSLSSKISFRTSLFQPTKLHYGIHLDVLVLAHPIPMNFHQKSQLVPHLFNNLNYFNSFPATFFQYCHAISPT
jgi:hypothetical protein